MDKYTKQATAEVVGKNATGLIKQMGTSVTALRAEMRQADGEAQRNAALALRKLREFKKLRGRKDGKNLSQDDAVKLLKAVDTTRKTMVEVQLKNTRIKNSDGTQKKGADGLTITERIRKEQQELATKDEIVALLKQINERREDLNEQKKDEHRNFKETLRKGLSAFLGPAGPLIETFISLKEEYGEDAKKVGAKITKWLGLEKNILKEYEKENEYNQRRDKKLFGMLSDKFRKFGSLLGGSGGLLSTLADFLGWGGGGKKGGGKGGATTRARRALRKARSGIGRTISRGAKGIGGIARKGLGALKGVGGKILGLGGKLLGPIGAALGIHSLLTGSVDAAQDKNESGWSKAGDYANGAMSGATIGGMIGSVFPIVGTGIGAAVGAVVGLIFTGVVRNWTSFKEGLAKGWDKVTDTAKNVWGTVKQFGGDFLDFHLGVYEKMRNGFGKVYDWMKENIPGFSKLMSFGKSAVAGAKQAAEWVGDKTTAVAKKAVEAKTIVVDKAKNAAEWVGDKVSAGANTVVDAGKVAVDKTKHAAAGVGTKAAAGVANTLDTAKQAGTAVATAAKTTAAVAVQKAGEIGTAVNEKATDVKIATTQAVEKTAQKVADKAADVATREEGTAVGGAAAVVNKKAQGLADFSGAIGGRAMLERQMTAAGITDPKERAMMLAQIDHESGFRARSENLNYSSVERIRSVFGKNKGIAGMSDAEVAKLVNNPEALANVVYADKNRSSKSKMGNTEEGDGYKYRGRGMIQLTGKANYEKYGKLLGIDLVNNPDLANDPAIAAQLATAYWKENNLGKAAREGDVTAVTQKINGGQNGAADREAKYAKYLREGQRSDTASTSIAASPDTTTVKTSVAPGVEGYERAASVTPSAAIIAASADTQRSEQGGLPLNQTTQRQATGASDVPFVLGDNHMVVINAGMMGA